MYHPDLIPFPILETKRLTLRELSPEDSERVFMLRSNERVNKYIDREPARCLADAEAHISRVLANEAEHKSALWVLCMKGTPALIGTVCLWNISADRKTAELGYEMLPEFYGQGLMNEAVGCVLKYGFEDAAFEHIEAFTHKDNESSIKLLERNGFKLLPERVDEDDPVIAIYALGKDGR